MIAAKLQKPITFFCGRYRALKPYCVCHNVMIPVRIRSLYSSVSHSEVQIQPIECPRSAICEKPFSAPFHLYNLGKVYSCFQHGPIIVIQLPSRNLVKESPHGHIHTRIWRDYYSQVLCSWATHNSISSAVTSFRFSTNVNAFVGTLFCHNDHYLII